jgi:ABC-type antimicrobial peptide transport system permease subunit
MPGYFKAMNIPLLAGRSIEKQDREGNPLVEVISETLAKSLFSDENPVGRKIVVDFFGLEQRVSEVVGVAGDVRIGGLGSSTSPIFYGSYFQTPNTQMQLAIRYSRSSEQVTSSLRKIVQRLDPNVPIAGIISMDDLISHSVYDREVVTLLLSIYALIAAFLAGIGLYGVLSYFVGERTREIGIRMALGASRSQIIELVVLKGLPIVSLGLLIGVAGAVVAVHLVRTLLFGISETDLITFLSVCFLLSVTALLSFIHPVRRAFSVDPVQTLNQE